MPRYVFKKDEPIRIKSAAKADAQVIGDELERIRQSAGGELEPKRVVEMARDLSNPLHPHFEWNDALAAEAYRVDQARNIIRIVRIVDDAADEPPRAFLSISGKTGVSYRSLEDVKRSAEFQGALLARAEADLEAFTQRYRELKDICEIVSAAAEKVKSRRKELRPSRAA